MPPGLGNLIAALGTPGIIIVVIVWLHMKTSARFDLINEEVKHLGVQLGSKVKEIDKDVVRSKDNIVDLYEKTNKNTTEIAKLDERTEGMLTRGSTS